MAEITLKSLILDYKRDAMTRELTGEWGSAVLYRPPAIVLAWLLARFDTPPMAVTIIGLLLLPIIILAAVVEPPVTAFYQICLLSIAFYVLDCTDGSLARALKRVSKLGDCVDSSADLLYRLTAYGALGHIADRLDATQSTSLTIALIAAWLSLFARAVRIYNGGLPLQNTESAPHRGPWTLKVIIFIYTALSGIDTLLPILAMIFWWLNVLPWLFIWLLFYGLADAIYSQAVVLWRVRRH
jgi:phosphatidylglycerophosphate synthase